MAWSGSFMFQGWTIPSTRHLTSPGKNWGVDQEKKKKKVDAIPHARSLQYAFQLTMHSNALRRLVAFKGFFKIQPPSLPQWIQLL